VYGDHQEIGTGFEYISSFSTSSVF